MESWETYISTEKALKLSINTKTALDSVCPSYVAKMHSLGLL